jgi:hypothetical protein
VIALLKLLEVEDTTKLKEENKTEENGTQKIEEKGAQKVKDKVVVFVNKRRTVKYLYELINCYMETLP